MTRIRAHVLILELVVSPEGRWDYEGKTRVSQVALGRLDPAGKGSPALSSSPLALPSAPPPS